MTDTPTTRRGRKKTRPDTPHVERHRRTARKTHKDRPHHRWALTQAYNARRRAGRVGKQCTVTASQLEALWTSSDHRCPLTGIEMTTESLGTGTSAINCAVAVLRDLDGDYHIENILLVSKRGAQSVAMTSRMTLLHDNKPPLPRPPVPTWRRWLKAILLRFLRWLD